jgi:hypothetical protein
MSHQVLFYVFFVLSAALVLVLFASVTALLLWGIKRTLKALGRLLSKID